jgi:hypothetical protein
MKCALKKTKRKQKQEKLSIWAENGKIHAGEENERQGKKVPKQKKRGRR